jgi:asparagine synthase (glutamine-hydrolysing)
MCGIAGIVRREPRGVDPAVLGQMAGAIRHRGPDGAGEYRDAYVGLAHVRLSIIDLVCGAQPMRSQDGRFVITYNGEVYNYLEVREDLVGRGYRFRTTSDTEVVLHAIQEWGSDALARFNGQFALVVYDRARRTLLMARDRFGVRPLYYAERGGDLYFASEAKALFASGEVPAAVDPEGLDQVFTFWAARPPRTVFRNVRQLEPGSFATWQDGELRLQRYYHLRYDDAPAEAPDTLARLDELMESGVRLRMRADVPVGGYLSGGLDSSVTAALAARMSPHELRTFSVTFADPRLDEAAYQNLVAGRIGSRHAVLPIGGPEVAAAFPDVVWHAETPLVRTAPAPMFLLSRLTRDHGIKVVLTGEGSDELFLGYDLFKETVVRLFCLRQPESRIRPRLFDRLYPYLDQAGRTGDFWRQFFLRAGPPSDPLFSHLPRIAITTWIKQFYSGDLRASLGIFDPLDELRDHLPADFGTWSPLNRAAYLEMVTLLSPYLLSSQGDRMGMAHAIEGRFPFLDHRLFEFAATLPTSSRLRGLREKSVLRRWAGAIVPPEVLARPKQPYRAPDIAAFFGEDMSETVRVALSAEAVGDSGLFDPSAVAGLLARCRAGKASGYRENQTFVALLSTQLWLRDFIQVPRRAPAVALADPWAAEIPDG